MYLQIQNAYLSENFSMPLNIYNEPLEKCPDHTYETNGSWMSDKTCSEIGGGVHQICYKSIGTNANQFSKNNNLEFKYKKPLSCPIDASSSINIIQTQKAIQKQLHTSSSSYLQTIKALEVSSDILKTTSKKPWNNASDRAKPHGLHINDVKNKVTSLKINNGVDIKHNSYDRYLAKKKANNLKTESNTKQLNPIKGNKTKYYSLTTKNYNCLSNC
mgnify:CR=1 FL=1